jgi:pyrimidine-nucleoside phosphorylase
VRIRAAELIERKRAGLELSGEEIAELVLGFSRGEVPDYQLAAFCMAVCFRGLSTAETFAVTDAMVRSGESIALAELVGRRVVDKHSTGGVGDKTTLAVGPVVAACGAPFAKMSGRGLGHTGGTLDKLESIPGFVVQLGLERFVEQVREIGIAVVGQTADLVPADRKLYALRDVTATVDSVPLIAASIMSKKLATGASAIVLDVKVGGGAFMTTLADARELARTLVALGERAGRDVVCLLTEMDQPLGRAVGNALEVREAIATLRGNGPPDFAELVLETAARLLELSDLRVGRAEARRRAQHAVSDGSALEVYEQWVRAQGGDPDEGALPRARIVREVGADRAGYVRRLDARAIGRAALHLGAGRREKVDAIDHSVGIVCVRKRGDAVVAGEPLAEVHAADARSADEAVGEVAAAYSLGDTPPPPQRLVLDTIG